MSKILCPYIPERTPSLEIYASGFYCFGCGESGNLNKLKETLGDINISLIERAAKKRTVPFSYEVNKILAMPKQKIRGLDLHCDESSYYIVWPDHAYYKKRLINKTTDKYRSPFAVKKTLFELPGSYKDLLVIEGELNALSAYEARGDFKIVSPGSVNEFTKYIDYYMQYEFIFLAFDYDRAGCDNAIKLRDHLVEICKKKVFLHPMEHDFNDILTKDGLDEVRREVDKISRMQEDLHPFREG